VRRLWPLFAALAVIIVLAVSLVSNRYGRAALTTAIFLPDLLVDFPVRPVTWITSDPIREDVTLRYPSGTMEAEVYRPGDDDPHGAFVFSMGAPPLDRDDERLVKLADAAARGGLVMLIPFSEDLYDELVTPEEVDALVAAFQYLQAQDYVKPDKIGYIGVSVGASLALLAASEDSINDDVDFVVSFGGYFDALDLLREVTTETISYDGHEEQWEPQRHTVRVMSKQIILRLDDARDREILWRVFIDREPATFAELDMLTPQGRASYEFLANRDPSRVDELLRDLPPDALEDLRLLSPSRTIDKLKAELFILHDQGDSYIPYVESRRLRDSLAGRAEVHYTELAIFNHVEPSSEKGALALFLDGSKLYFRLYQLLLRLS
jgi:acetyl esterase/lipase